MTDGGDRRTPRAKVDIAQREQQIVALKLRGIPTPGVLANDLRLYIRHAWHVVEPSTVYLENCRIELIAEHREAVTVGSD